MVLLLEEVIAAPRDTQSVMAAIFGEVKVPLNSFRRVADERGKVLPLLTRENFFVKVADRVRRAKKGKRPQP
jgi:hypothetical protein